MARTRRVVALLASLTLTLSSLAAATPSATSTVTITSLSFSPTAISPIDVTPLPVSVSVGLSSELPIQDDCALLDSDGSVLLDHAFVKITRVTPADPRTTGSPDELLGRIGRTSGTATSGVWTASFPVASTWTGTWQVSEVFACTGNEPGDAMIGVDPRTIGHTASLTVTGSHLPNLYLRQTPNPVLWTAKTYTVWGRVYDTETRSGIPHLRMERCESSGCGIDGWAGTPVTTDSRGYFSITSFPMAPDARAIVLFAGFPAAWQEFGATVFQVWVDHPAVLPSVVVTPPKEKIRSGRTVTVHGHMFGVLGCGADWNGPLRHPIQIQYLHGRTAWRPVATTTTRPSARWTAVYAARSGRNVYRAYHPLESVPLAGVCVGASSKSFVVTGTT